MRESLAMVALEIRYVRSGGVAVAYQVVGEGDRTSCSCPTSARTSSTGGSRPYWRPFYERLAESFRLILFDKRGTGLSDRGGSFPTLETRMEDVRAVMDAVGSERAVIFGSHEGCLMATLFAATYPGGDVRARALPSARSSSTSTRPRGVARTSDPGALGHQELCDRDARAEICPTLAAIEEGSAWFANWLRVGASPAMGYELNRAFAETDLSEVYAAVRAPTLVLYRDTPSVERRIESRGVAALIRSARRCGCPAATTGGSSFRSRSSTSSSGSSAGDADSADPGERPDRPCCSPTSSDRASSRPTSAIEPGATCSHATTPRCDASSHTSADKSATPPATASSPPSTARHARSAAPKPRSRPCEPLGIEIRVGIHTGECELHDGKAAGVALPIGARICAARRDRTRCLSPARSRISSPAPASHSPLPENTI